MERDDGRNSLGMFKEIKHKGSFESMKHKRSQGLSPPWAWVSLRTPPPHFCATWSRSGRSP